MNDQSTNLRFLLWQKKVPRKDWLKEIANWFGGDLNRAREILNNKTISKEELDFFQKNFHHSEDEIMEILQGNLLSNNKISIFMENFDYLLEQLNDQKQGEVLSKIGISRSTYSRLKNNQQTPNSNTRRKICDFFGINEATDLNEEPLFLSLEPIGIYLQKQWLCERINQISGTELQKLFPALRRIFDEHYDS